MSARLPAPAGGTP
ncbi:Protein of unknown function [Propionibacterium freudenreichii subsp. freudenreichii]|uniref:Uncharacterized protein n=1 Tax=Propionibacterium freudenreichii subsp. freudenreichii TaxID=66712 RepID=A0A0B7NXK5_PROFF|nr:Protein of unknown function [Propionibacterium freudenreichii]CEP25699.1 Protein of unknown function [Propionibacterium freudenreichii subsp. freudenreichii]